MRRARPGCGAVNDQPSLGALTSRGDFGFSMVEALVALAVFALAGVGLVSLQTHSVSSLHKVETQALASVVAQNTLVETIAARTPPDIGTTEEEVRYGGRTWRWRRVIEPTTEAGVVRVTVSVVDAAKAGQPVRIHGFRVRGDGGS